MKPRILIIHPGTLGDVLLSLLAIRNVRCSLPTHECVLLAKAEIGRLFKEYGVVEHMLDLDGPVFSELLRESTVPSPLLTESFVNCTHVVAWLRDHDHRLSKKFRQVGIRHSWIFSPHQDSLRSGHQAGRYCEILGLDVPDRPDRHLLGRFSCNGRRRVVKQKAANPLAENGMDVIFVHPGSGSRHKCVSVQRLSTIIKRLSAKGDRRILVSQGPDDEDIVSALKPLLGKVGFRLITHVDLLGMAQELQQATVFVGHDSGITHLAAALGVPTVALFGPTDPNRWAPRGQHVNVLKGPECQCHDWDSVRSCLEKRCLTHSVDEVVGNVERLLAVVHETGPQRELMGVH